jgi:WD40 repeat protein
VFSVDVTADGRIAVTGSQDRTIKVWRLPTDPIVAKAPWPAEHLRRVNVVARTPNGDRVVSVSQDYTLKVWNGPTGELRHTCADIAGWAQSLALSDNGQYAVTGSLATIYVHDVERGRLAFRRPVAGVDGIRSLARSPDGRAFMLGSAQGDIFQLIDGDWTPRGPLRGHDAPVNMLSFAPDSVLLASASDDRTVRVWNLNTFTHQVLHHDAPVQAVCFTHDGRSVITGADDGIIRTWDATTGEPLSRFTAHHGWILGLTRSPDGRHLISIAEDSTLAIWDTRQQTLITRIGLDAIPWCVSELTADSLLALGDLAGGVQVVQLNLAHHDD